MTFCVFVLKQRIVPRPVLPSAPAMTRVPQTGLIHLEKQKREHTYLESGSARCSCRQSARGLDNRMTNPPTSVVPKAPMMDSPTRTSVQNAGDVRRDAYLRGFAHEQGRSSFTCLCSVERRARSFIEPRRFCAAQVSTSSRANNEGVYLHIHAQAVRRCRVHCGVSLNPHHKWRIRTNLANENTRRSSRLGRGAAYI